MARTEIQHLGVACQTIEAGLTVFGLSRDDITETYHDSEQHNMLYFIFLPGNNLWLEFVVPINKDSTIYSSIKRSEVNLHHLGFASRSLEDEIMSISNIAGAFELGGYSLNIKSFGGNIRTKFFALKGVIIEFVESVING